MKKLMGLLSLIAIMLCILPANVSADSKSVNIPAYGTLTIDETPWTSENKVVTQVYSITKSGPITAITIIPVLNVSNVKITASSYFDIIDEQTGSDGSVTVYLKAKNGTGVNGTKTELLTAVADGNDNIPSEGCNLSYSPISLNCSTKVEGYYFDDNGNSITEEEYKEACEGVVPPSNDVPSPDTGSVVPYIAVGGGLIAIAGVYLYSRKSNKVYKI